MKLDTVSTRICSEWLLEDCLLGLIAYDPDTEGRLTGELIRRKLVCNLQRAGLILNEHINSLTSDSGGDMAKCAQECVKEHEILPHSCGAYCIQLHPKLLIFTDLFDKSGTKRKLLVQKGGRALRDQEFDNLAEVRKLIDMHMTIVDKLSSTMHRGSFKAISR